MIGRGEAIFAKQICHEAKRSLLASSRKTNDYRKQKRANTVRPYEKIIKSIVGTGVLDGPLLTIKVKQPHCMLILFSLTTPYFFDMIKVENKVFEKN